MRRREFVAGLGGGANHFDRRSIEIKAKRLAAQIAKLGYQIEIRQMPQTA